MNSQAKPIIDNTGIVYASIREFCRKRNVAKGHVIAALKKKGEYTNYRKGIVATYANPTPPPPSVGRWAI